MSNVYTVYFTRPNGGLTGFETTADNETEAMNKVLAQYDTADLLLSHAKKLYSVETVSKEYKTRRFNGD